jgi:hypothetical protein
MQGHPLIAHVPVHFARELERELNSATADLVVMQARVAAMQRCIDERTAERDEARRKVKAIEAMGYDWRWTLSIDADGEQIGVWFMRDEVQP